MNFENKVIDPESVKIVVDSYYDSICNAHDLRIENQRLRGLIKMMHPDIDIDRFIHRYEDGNIEW